MHCTSCDRNTNADSDASCVAIARSNAGARSAVPTDAVQVVARLRVHAGGDAMSESTMDHAVDAQVMCIYFAKLAAHNRQRALAWRLVQIAMNMDWELYRADEESRKKEVES